MKKTAAVILGLLLVPSLLPAQTDPKTQAYLQKLSQYYYCLSREGLKSFQCEATATLSGQVPEGIKSDWEGYNWQASQCRYDFSYLGGEVLPILSFSSGGGDPLATPGKFRKLTNLSNALLLAWGAFSAMPLYSEHNKNSVQTISRGTRSYFSITSRSKNADYTLDFDQQALAQRIITQNGKTAQEMKLTFIRTPQGALLKQVELDIPLRGGRHTLVDLFAEYQTVQGFQLPATFTLFERTPGQLFKAVYQMSHYQIQKKGEAGAVTDGGDTQIVPASVENPGTKHFLWRVRSATATVYLLGSIHVRPDSPLQMPEVVERSFEESNYVGFEFDLSQLDQIHKDSMAYYLQNCTYPANDSLIRHLTPLDWARVRVLLKRYGMKEKDAARFKPYILDQVIALSAAGRKSSVSKEKGIDNIFLRKAQLLKKPVFGMEFWWAPFKELDTLSDHDQAVYLLGGDQSTHNHVRFYPEILADWKTGNTVDLDALVNSDIDAEEKPIMEKIIQKRNANWLPQLDRILQTKGVYFIVVGSGHLVGPDGLPNSLKLRGYSVEQL